jgi:putative Ca2+/H+ antiporter (TMEM165/GDT1 family)
MPSTCRTYAALLLVAAALAAIAAVLMPAPASAMETHAPTGRYTSAACASPDGAQTTDRTFAEHVVGCGTELDAVTVAHLAFLRDAVCEGLSAHVPADRMVDRLAGELGDRTQAVTLFTDANVWCTSGR